MNKVKWGVLGTAYIFERDTARGMKLAKNCELTAIAGRTQEKADAFREKYGFARAYGSYEELLKDPEIEAVYIALPNTLHYEWTIKALQHGKHVLCEKPMAVTMEECEAMVRTAKEMCRCLMIGQNQRLQSPQKAKALLAEGAIGELLSFRTTFGHAGPETWSINQTGKDLWFFDEKAAGMGVMGDLGIQTTMSIVEISGRR